MKIGEVQTLSSPTTLELGFSTFFLNRTNRSGILKGGVIGGLSQEGDYPLDCRFKKDDLIQRIRRIALYADQIRLTRKDAEAYIRGDLRKLDKRCLVNIDPPYYRKGPGLYTSFYEHEDHVSLATAIKRLKLPWMLTYDDAPEIRAAYPDVSLKAARLKRDAARLVQQQGTDPVQQRRLEKLKRKAESLTTFEAVAREFHATKESGWSKPYGARWLERLEKDVFPWIGSLPFKAA